MGGQAPCPTRLRRQPPRALAALGSCPETPSRPQLCQKRPQLCQTPTVEGVCFPLTPTAMPDADSLSETAKLPSGYEPFELALLQHLEAVQKNIHPTRPQLCQKQQSRHQVTGLLTSTTDTPAAQQSCATLSDTTYSLSGSRKSSPSQNRHLDILISNSKQQVHNFVEKLTN